MPFDRAATYKVFDRLEVPQAIGFYERLLNRYDTSLVEWIKLISLPRSAWSFHSDRPVRTEPRSRSFEQGYRIRGGVNPKLRFPVRWEVHVGWDRPQPGMEGERLVRTTTFATLAEVAVTALGCAVYRFLRHSKQVPGLDNRNRARRHGLYCLAVFRSGYEFDPFEATDRLVARDALEEAGDAESPSLLDPYPDD